MGRLHSNKRHMSSHCLMQTIHEAFRMRFWKDRGLSPHGEHGQRAAWSMAPTDWGATSAAAPLRPETRGMPATASDWVPDVEVACVSWPKMDDDQRSSSSDNCLDAHPNNTTKTPHRTPIQILSMMLCLPYRHCPFSGSDKIQTDT